MGNKKVNIEYVPTNIRHIMQFLKQFNTCDMYFTLSSYQVNIPTLRPDLAWIQSLTSTNVSLNMGCVTVHFDFSSTVLFYFTVHSFYWIDICSVCRIYNPVISTFMTYRWVCKRSNTTRVARFHTRFVMGFVLFDLQFYVYVLQITVCPLSFGHCVDCSSSIYGF